MKSDRVLFIFAVVFFILFDMVSTIAAFNFLGSAEYEQSLFLRLALEYAGVYGFVLVKGVFGALALALGYALVLYFPGFANVGRGILAGAGFAGLFVGLSNFNIIVNGSSFWILGVDSGTISALIIIAMPVLFVLFGFCRFDDKAISEQ